MRAASNAWLPMVAGALQWPQTAAGELWVGAGSLRAAAGGL